ncbi:MAG: galactosyltransferase-related protein [Formosimonas sp.]
MNKQSLKHSDVIVSFRASTQERADNLSVFLRYLDSTFVDYRVLIVEGDTAPRAPSQWFADERVCHHFVHSEGAFPKSLLYNTGAKLARSDVIIFNDADVMVQPAAFDAALGAVAANPRLHVSPFYHFVNVKNSAKQRFALSPSHQHFSDVVTDGSHPEYTVLSLGNVGGANVLNRSTFMSMGGFNSNMAGWGSEDGEFYVRWQRAGLEWYAIDFVALHLHHDNDNRDDLKKTEQTRANLRTELYAREMPEHELAQLTQELKAFFEVVRD